MHLTNSQNTCSQAELCSIYAESTREFSENLASLVSKAKTESRKSIIANMHAHEHETYGSALKAAGFTFVGKYPGNSDTWVYMWVYGLVPKPKTTVLKTLKARIARKRPVR